MAFEPIAVSVKMSFSFCSYGNIVYFCHVLLNRTFLAWFWLYLFCKAIQITN